MRLICENNLTIHRVAFSKNIRRLQRKSYPTDPPPRKHLPRKGNISRKMLLRSGSHLEKGLANFVQAVCFSTSLDNITAFRLLLVPKIHFPSERRPSISFGEATVTGSDSHLTLNQRHSIEVLRNSKVASLGVIRVHEQATGEYLQDFVRLRLDEVGLSANEIVAAANKNALCTD